MELDVSQHRYTQSEQALTRFDIKIQVTAYWKFNIVIPQAGLSTPVHLFRRLEGKSRHRLPPPRKDAKPSYMGAAFGAYGYYFHLNTAAIAQSVQRDSIPGRGKRFYCSAQRPASYPMGTGCCFSEGKTAGA
jgi:hypothetical protein